MKRNVLKRMRFVLPHHERTSTNKCLTECDPKRACDATTEIGRAVQHQGMTWMITLLRSVDALSRHSNAFLQSHEAIRVAQKTVEADSRRVGALGVLTWRRNAHPRECSVALEYQKPVLVRCTTAEPVHGAKRQRLLKHERGASERACGIISQRGQPSIQVSDWNGSQKPR